MWLFPFKIPNISLLFGLYVETYGSMSSVFFSVVVNSKFLGIDVAFLKPSIINLSG